MAPPSEKTRLGEREAKKIALTAQEKVLLYLLGYGKFQDQWDVPVAVTQTEISKATRILRNNIPRTMNKLIEKHYVYRKTAHVRGRIRRRIVYFLTNKGEKKAKDMEVSLQKIPVFIKDINGKSKWAKLGEVSQSLPDKTPLLKIILHISEDGIFDCKTFQAQTATDSGEGYIDFTAHAPKLRYFFGRKAELNDISKWLESDTSKLLVLYGIAGCGKTTLAGKVVETVKSKMNVFWYQIHEWDTTKNILASLSKFLYQCGRKDMKAFLNGNNKNNGVDINEVTELLEGQLHDLNALLVFDDFHKTNNSIHSFFLALRERLERIDNVKMMVIGRHINHFYDSREIAIKKVVTEMQLVGLDRKGSRELLKLRNIKEFDRIYELTEGHPLFLELIEYADDLRRNSNLKRYIHEEIFSQLTEDEKSVLKFMSVLNNPVPSDMLFIDGSMASIIGSNMVGISYETLRRLKDKSLIFEILPGKYGTHGLVKEFFNRTLPPQLKQRIKASLSK